MPQYCQWIAYDLLAIISGPLSGLLKHGMQLVMMSTWQKSRHCNASILSVECL